MNEPPRGLFFILHRLVLFLTLFQIALFALFAAGSLNRCQDRTLIFILHGGTLCAWILLAVLVPYLCLTVLLGALTRRPAYLLHLLLWALSLAIALGLGFFSRSLPLWSAV
ncbi:MAG: hypothetical protein LBR23_07070 [Spirochaetaceae bacterium]|jgi:hypothetical protein|nr:hypothetical protein [Spirochaetaceae bacterium]